MCTIALGYRRLGVSFVDFPTCGVVQASVTSLRSSMKVPALHEPGDVVLRRLGRFSESSLRLGHVRVVL